MITNIIDKRTNPYNILCDAVYEPSCHDNPAAERTKGTIFPPNQDFSYDELERTSITAALRYGNEKWPSTPTTLYLYDWESINTPHMEMGKKEVTDGVFAYPYQPGGPFELPEIDDENHGC